ncbi:histone protein [Labilithrix luteola]|uniref:Histone protein n=1 Tax=Labilithrix luteola TaxID=1391654 RepID=A0A0K1Q7K6_9BACT|nr:hypothetical protein [Labilithrix luteola]AKV01713.1 histone protein [Labilithrix luteola]
MIASKLRITEKHAVAMVGDARGYVLELPRGTKLLSSGKADVVVAFVVHEKDVAKTLKLAGSRRAPSGLVWFAYPKAKQLGTDLNRDSLAHAIQAAGWEPVAQVALDAEWSALRLKVDAELSAARTARGAFAAKATKKTAAKASTKKATAKKTAAKKPAAKKPAAKKTAAKKSAPKKTAPTKPSAKKTSAKTPTKKAGAKKRAARA